jgi:phospholipid/cholesterol/gamma-HCH transport system permease protein
VLNLFESVGHYSVFALRALFAALFSVARPREALRQFYAVFIGALPLAIVAGLAIGIVLWMHLRGMLVRFGGTEAAQYLPTAVALAVTMEFAPIGAGLILAGRSGASLGAELGSMRLTEQIDAFEVLGFSAMRVLVGPRVLACLLALPILTVFMDYLALLGSFMAEHFASGVGWLQYRSACLIGLRFPDTLLAALKPVAFGYLVGVAGCYFGMHADGGTEGVGRAATRGVVVATLSVLLANVVLVRLIQLVV